MKSESTNSKLVSNFDFSSQTKNTKIKYVRVRYGYNI